MYNIRNNSPVLNFRNLKRHHRVALFNVFIKRRLNALSDSQKLVFNDIVDSIDLNEYIDICEYGITERNDVIFVLVEVISLKLYLKGITSISMEQLSNIIHEFVVKYSDSL